MDTEIYCFILKKEGLQVRRETLEREEFCDTVSDLLSSIRQQDKPGTGKEQAQKLYTLIVKFLKADIATSRELIVIPDGLLNYIPFEVLHDGEHFLVETHTISYAPSVSFLLGSRHQRKTAEGFLGFGEPAYDEGGGSIARVESLTRGYFRSREVAWTPLPGTRKELETIKKLVPGEKALFLGKDATEEKVKELASQYGTLHFATHGMLDDRKPLLYSALILAGANSRETDDGNDGYLRAAEIFTMSLNCDLVVLSGCQTGLGKNLSGEGLLGLSTAFFHAGAQSLIVSLWPVDDESTARLFGYFYENLLTLPRAEALREAKLRLMKEKESPFYWAPFILQEGVTRGTGHREDQ